MNETTGESVTRIRTEDVPWLMKPSDGWTWWLGWDHQDFLGISLIYEMVFREDGRLRWEPAMPEDV